MKSILFVASFPPPYGGVAVFNSLLYEKMRKDKLDIDCMTVGEEGKKGLPLEIKGYMLSLMRQKGKRIICDSANIFLEYPFGRAPFYRGYLWCINNKIKRNVWIKILHDGSLPKRYQKFTRVQKNFVRRMLRQTESIVVVNPLLEQFLRKEVGYRKKVVQIGSLLPMELNANAVLPDSITAFLNAYDKIILSVGTCDGSYGFYQIIEAFKKVADRLADIKIGLILVDCGFAEKSALYEKKRGQMAKEKNVLLYSGGLPHETVLQLMKKSDTFVRGVSLESYGISRAEAIMCGTPVIATSVGKTDGMRLYEYGDIQTLQEHLIEVLSQEEDTDLHKWTDFFNNEAEYNYRSLIDLLVSRYGNR